MTVVARVARWCRGTATIWWLSPALIYLTSAASQASELEDPPTRWTEGLYRVVMLRDYNTRVVLAGATVMGVTAGVVGVFMLLRKRALLGDVVSHAAFPGVAIAYLCAELTSPGTGKTLSYLLVGATVGGVFGAMATSWIRRATRVKDDAALAIVLSVLFGVGITALSIVQRLETGNAAGLTNFIYGKTASMTWSDLKLIVIASVVVAGVVMLLFKELTLLCFDEQFGASHGWPTASIDMCLNMLVVAVCVIGMQTVGLLLVVAMLIIPAAAARFWSDRIGTMTCIAGGFGAVSSATGVVVSSIVPDLATGALIVLFAASLFVGSMLFGVRQGLVPRGYLLFRLRRKTAIHHLLRAFYEAAEVRTQLNGQLPTSLLLSHLGWKERTFAGVAQRGVRKGLVRRDGQEMSLTELGQRESARIVRNHRLWELYLIRYADIAPTHVDRDADQIEHIIEGDILHELERTLAQSADQEVPQSPHAVAVSHPSAVVSGDGQSTKSEGS